MSATSSLILFLFAIGGAFIQRVSGFGFGIFIMTILPYIMPSYGECTTLSGLMGSVTSIIIVVKMWKHISWHKLWPILLTFLIISFFAVQMLSQAGDVLLKRILGAVLILVSLYFFFLSEKIKVKPTIPTQISMGTISGLMGGFFAMQGPPAVLYFIASTKTKEEYVAISQCYFLTGNIFMTIFRYYNGYLTPAVGIAWLYGLLGVIIGTALGAKVFQRISTPTLKKIIYFYMAICGLLALLS